jgi:hypothetical protein
MSGGHTGVTRDRGPLSGALRFRAQLALRLAVPIDPPERAAAATLACAAVPAAAPVTVALIAPSGRLGAGTLLGLLCAALPGLAGTGWAAARLRVRRLVTDQVLRQAGSGPRTARVVAAGRVCLFAGLGAGVGSICVAVLHAPLGSVSPRHSPLHGLFGTDALGWLVSAAVTAVLIIGLALAASSRLPVGAGWSGPRPAVFDRGLETGAPPRPMPDRARVRARRGWRRRR